MVLSSFIALQFGLSLLALGSVYFLHTRRLRTETSTLLDAWTAARADSDAASTDEARLAWLAARAAALDPKDTETQIRKLILENEGKDLKKLPVLLKPLLGSPGLSEQWATLRTEQYNTVAELVSTSPGRARAAMDAFEAYAALDQALDFAPPQWPELPEGTVNEADALQAEITALKAELEHVTAGTDDDLRKLLKQFTQDSREMMGCIQQLEKENQALKSQLAAAA